MAESPKRPADVSRAEASRIVKPAKPAGAMGETARAADSVPLVTGPFATLPTQFGRYRIEKLLGKGAMGAVYLAHDIQLDRPVALKVARVSTSGSAKLIKRMETEAKAAAKVDHPLICKVCDFGEIDGIRFIALPYIDGEDLKSYLKRVGKRREPDEAMRWTVQLARALKAAHDKGVIHRDLKPENVMLNPHGEPVIMDFGLARRTTGATDAGLTQGMILGTAAYMSPEQAIGRAEGIDHRSDLYALGVMLFEMLTGEWPFTGSAIEIMGRKSVCEAPSPLTLNANIPPQLAAVCHKLIAKKKEDRCATCAEIIAALEAVDLKAPVALEKHVEFESAPQPLEFLQEPPAAPVWLKPAKAGEQQRIVSPILRRLEPLTQWWRGQSLAMRWSVLGGSGFVLCLLVVITSVITGKDGAKTKSEVAEEAKPALARSLEKPVRPPPLTPVQDSHAKTSQAEWAKFLGKKVVEKNRFGMELVLIPPGTFQMGSPTSEAQRQYDEGPQHTVQISRPFYMGVNEVTQGEYEQVMGTNPSYFSKTGSGSSSVSGMDTSKFPVEKVSWFDSVEFCNKLSVKDGLTPYYSLATVTRESGSIKSAMVEVSRPASAPGQLGYRLPTEAEWEYACRANMTTPFHFGSVLNGHKANVDGNHPFGTTTKGKYLERTTTVGSYAKNDFGLFDMHGNVWEWCDDVFDAEAYSKRSGTTPDPRVTSGSEDRVLRGGCWLNYAGDTRSADRLRFTPGNRDSDYGFRVVCLGVRTP